MKKLMVLFVVMAMVLPMALTGCGGAQQAPDEAQSAAGNPEGDTIVIGVFEPLTGDAAQGGQLTVDGIKLAHELYGEVNGKKIDLKVVDNKSDQAEATTAVARLIDKEKANVIVGSYGSSYSMAAGETLKNQGVPAIGCSPTNPLVTKDNDYYFRGCFIDPFQGTVLANYAIDDQNFKKAALLVNKGNAYSVGLANYFKKAFEAKGGEIVAEQQYQKGDQDYTAQLNTIKQANPDVILLPGEYAEMALGVDQARKMGLKAPFFGGDTVDVDKFLDYGDLVEGVTISSHFDPAQPELTDETAKFMEAFKAKYPDATPGAFQALGYDAYLLAVDAIERAGSADSDKIRDALAETDGFEGATGVITLDENGDATKPAVIREVENGKFEYVATVQPE